MRTRWRLLSEDEAAEMRAELERTRDRVLDGAGVRAGETVVDVGAGTGLLTFGAHERVGADGRVVAIDVSVDALYELLATAHGIGAAGIGLLIGSADVLPLPDASADVVVTRSVLIYVDDKAEAAREFFRVLRAGGRVSLFEPINRRNRPLAETVDFGGLADVVRDWQAATRAADDPMLDFDERDLERHFVAAGFEVELELGASERELEAERLLTAIGAPGRRSLLDEWRATLGEATAERLADRVREQRVARVEWPYAYLRARKP